MITPEKNVKLDDFIQNILSWRFEEVYNFFKKRAQISVESTDEHY